MMEAENGSLELAMACILRIFLGEEERGVTPYAPGKLSGKRHGSLRRKYSLGTLKL
jgi:hypothetical protein